MKLVLRQLAKSPGFAVTAIFTVALGIGAATAMFSTVNALVLRPVALPNPDRLVAVYETNLARNLPFFACSYPDYVDWRERTKSWEALGAMGERGLLLRARDESGPGQQEARDVLMRLNRGGAKT